MIDKKERKPKIMLHLIMPNQISGPNKSAELIANSFLNELYEFSFLTQKIHSGRKINVSLIRDLKNQIKIFDPDIIHISGLLGAGFHAVLAAHLSGKRNILLTIRGSAIDAKNISHFTKFIFGKIIEPITMRLSRKVYAVCDAMAKRDHIVKNTKNRIIDTIHNSAPNIDLDCIQSYNLKKKLDVSTDSILVAVVGRIIYDKGVTFIADAIKKIDDKKIKFIFIGEEPRQLNLSDCLIDEIRLKRVFFLGKQDNVIPILKECDIFLSATLHENLSNALLEACSIGLAVITTKIGGNPEVIQNDYNGLLIPPEDSDKIRDSVIYLASNKELREKFGAKAIETIENKFSQRFIFKKLYNVYQDMLS